MAYAVPGPTNIFPYLDSDIRIMYARNPRKMPLARYALYGDVSKQISYFTRINSNVGIKIPGSNKNHAIWADGQDRPQGQHNKISHSFDNLTLHRHLHNFPHGAIALANQPYDIISNNMLLMAQKAGTLRALWAYLEINAAVTATTIPTSTLSAATGDTDVSAGTTTDPKFLKALLYAAQYIHQHTNGVVNEQYLKVVMGPLVARKLATSAEMRDYVKGSPDAMKVMSRGFSNARFGLPMEYYGFELVVEDTVIDTGNPGTTTLADVFSTDDIWVLARVDKNMGSGIEAPSPLEGENVFPTTFSCLTLFEGPFWSLTDSGKTEVRDGTYGMGSEIWVDTKNERVEGAIRDNFTTKVTAGDSGFVFTDVLP